ncbi:MAG: ATP-binding protein [Gammaproteobacteria bacterium]
MKTRTDGRTGRAGPGIGLRGKLLAVSLALLSLPWAGYQYLKGMEDYLRDRQEDALRATAQAVATALRERPGLFPPAGDGPSLYAFPLPQAPQLDGYADDWGDLRHNGQPLEHHGPDQRRTVHTQNATPTAGPTLLLGTREERLFGLIRVPGGVSHFQRNPGQPRSGDHIELTARTRSGITRRYLFATAAPGWLNARLAYRDGAGTERYWNENRIPAQWTALADGWALEFSMPASLAAGGLGVSVVSPLDGQKEPTPGVGTARDGTPLPLILPSQAISDMLAALDRSRARIWVVDRRGRVLAMGGGLQSPADLAAGQSLLSRLALLGRALLGPGFSDPRQHAGRLDGPEVQGALEGRALLRRRALGDGTTHLLTASGPVDSRSTGRKQVIGAVLAEQTTAAILTLQGRALEQLLALTLAVFAAVALLLVLFAARLSGRIRRLRDAASGAIAEDGQVLDVEVPGTRAADEIGDLARDVDTMLARLRQYTRYLETMAGKLSHELRTPVAVVRSSLDNLDSMDLGPDAHTYSTRAREGLERLSTILTRMSEARRLEQAIDQMDRETFDLAALVRNCAQGYRDAYPDANLEIDLPAGPAWVDGSPDLIAQALDKLVDNAVDFSIDDAPVGLTIHGTDRVWRLAVSNRGPALPGNMREGLFDSMVSVRTAGTDSTSPHLGLGLYIVRLVAHFHGGRVHAENRAPDTVRFSLDLPKAIAASSSPAVGST